MLKIHPIKTIFLVVFYVAAIPISLLASGIIWVGERLEDAITKMEGKLR